MGNKRSQNSDRVNKVNRPMGLVIKYMGVGSKTEKKRKIRIGLGFDQTQFFWASKL
jgi:hypothetical protein